MSFKPGNYQIRTPDKLTTIGIGSRNGNSGPYPIVLIHNIIDVPDTKFTFEKVGDNEYIVKCHGYYVVVIDGLLCADPTKPTTQNTWKVKEFKNPEGIGMNYVITDAQKGIQLGWKNPEENQVSVGPIAETRSQPPRYINAEWKMDNLII